jgi:hypothetical protein
MLLEDLLGLPTGTRLFGHTAVAMNVAGVIDPLEGGSHFIRWEDSSVTVPLGWVRDDDEYIVAHARLAPALNSKESRSAGVVNGLQRMWCSDFAKKGERKCSRPM